MPAADLEPAVSGRVREICANPEIRTEVGRRLGAGKAAIADDLTEKRAVLEERIEKLTAEGKALIASIKQMGGKGGTPLPARLGEIEAELDGLCTRALPARPGARHRAPPAPGAAEPSLDRAAGVWRRLRPAQVATVR